MRSDARLIPFEHSDAKIELGTLGEGARMIHADQIWEEGRYGAGVVIAILDTGCQRDHPDVQHAIVGGHNYTTDYRGDPRRFDDNNGHGTHVAGIIAANGKLIGAAPRAKLLIFKVLRKDGSGSIESIIRALWDAANWRSRDGRTVRVISLSLGTSEDDPMLHRAVRYAVRKGILVVCAAGNNGGDPINAQQILYPAGYHEVVEVGAVDRFGRIAEFSSTNSQIDLVAPGVDIVSTYINGGYMALSGTSMATPHVAAAAALLINQSERMPAESMRYGQGRRQIGEGELFRRLVSCTLSLGYPVWQQGYGMLDLSQAARSPGGTEPDPSRDASPGTRSRPSVRITP